MPAVSIRRIAAGDGALAGLGEGGESPRPSGEAEPRLGGDADEGTGKKRAADFPHQAGDEGLGFVDFNDDILTGAGDAG